MTRSATALRLLGFMRPLWWAMSLSIITRVGRMCAEIALPAIGVWGLASFLTNEGISIFSVILALVAVAGVKGLLRYVEQYMGHLVAFKLLAMLRTDFYRSIVPLAPAGLSSARSGDLVSRVIADVDRVEPFYAHTIAPVAAAVAVPAIVLGALSMLFDPVLAWTLAPFLVVVGVVVPALSHRLGIRRVRLLRRTAGEVNAHLTDSIQGINEVVAFGRRQQRIEEVAVLGDETRRAQRALGRAAAVRAGVNDLAIGIGVLAVLAAGLGLVGAGTLDIGAVATAVAITMGVFPSVKVIEEVWDDLDTALESAHRIHEMVDRPPAVDDGGPPGKQPQPREATLAFENVTFTYPTRDTPALRDVTLEVPAGSVVAVVGPSGSGKTTLVNLALRFWDPNTGRVTMSGIDVRELPAATVRSQVSVVSQRTHLFNVSVRDNLLLGKLNASAREVEAACRRAAIHDFIIGLPDGYDTKIGEMGARLSGGQRQRIAVARALLKNAPVLILDEATSELDLGTEAEIQAALADLMEGRTVIVIAHRLSTVVDADLIAVLENGVVAETGTHTDLLAADGPYARLFATDNDMLDRLLDLEPHT